MADEQIYFSIEGDDNLGPKVDNLGSSFEDVGVKAEAGLDKAGRALQRLYNQLQVAQQKVNQLSQIPEPTYNERRKLGRATTRVSEIQQLQPGWFDQTTGEIKKLEGSFRQMGQVAEATVRDVTGEFENLQRTVASLSNEVTSSGLVEIPELAETSSAALDRLRIKFEQLTGPILADSQNVDRLFKRLGEGMQVGHQADDIDRQLLQISGTVFRLAVSIDELAQVFPQLSEGSAVFGASWDKAADNIEHRLIAIIQNMQFLSVLMRDELSQSSNEIGRTYEQNLNKYYQAINRFGISIASSARVSVRSIEQMFAEVQAQFKALPAGMGAVNTSTAAELMQGFHPGRALGSAQDELADYRVNRGQTIEQVTQEYYKLREAIKATQQQLREGGTTLSAGIINDLPRQLTRLQQLTQLMGGAARIIARELPPVGPIQLPPGQLSRLLPPPRYQGEVVPPDNIPGGGGDRYQKLLTGFEPYGLLPSPRFGVRVPQPSQFGNPYYTPYENQLGTGRPENQLSLPSPRFGVIMKQWEAAMENYSRMLGPGTTFQPRGLLTPATEEGYRQMNERYQYGEDIRAFNQGLTRNAVAPQRQLGTGRVPLQLSAKTDTDLYSLMYPDRRGYEDPIDRMNRERREAIDARYRTVTNGVTPREMLPPGGGLLDRLQNYSGPLTPLPYSAGEQMRIGGVISGTGDYQSRNAQMGAGAGSSIPTPSEDVVRRLREIIDQEERLGTTSRDAAGAISGSFRPIPSQLRPIEASVESITRAFRQMATGANPGALGQLRTALQGAGVPTGQIDSAVTTLQRRYERMKQITEKGEADIIRTRSNAEQLIYQSSGSEGGITPEQEMGIRQAAQNRISGIREKIDQAQAPFQGVDTGGVGNWREFNQVLGQVYTTLQQLPQGEERVIRSTQLLGSSGRQLVDGLGPAINALNRLRDAENQAGSFTPRQGNFASQLGRQYEVVGNSIQQLQERIAAMLREAEQAPGDRFSATYIRQLQAAQRQVDKLAADSQAKLSRLSVGGSKPTTLGSAEISLPQFNASFENNVQGLNSKLTGLQQGVRKVGDEAEKTGERGSGAFHRIGQIVSGMLIYQGVQGLIQGFGELSRQLVAQPAQIESWGNQYTRQLGSVEAAEKRVNDLFNASMTMGSSFENLVELDQMMTNFGIDSDTTSKRFGRSMTDIEKIMANAAAAAKGVDVTDIGDIFIQGMSDPGEALRRLRRMGLVTDEELKKIGVQFSSTSNSIISDSDTFLSALLTLWDRKFGGLSDVQSKTFTGMTQKFMDFMGRVATIVGTPIFKQIEQHLEGLLATLSDPATLDSLAVWGDRIGRLGTIAFTAFDLAGKALGGFLNILTPVADFFGASLDDLNSKGVNLGQLFDPAAAGLNNMGAAYQGTLDTAEDFDAEQHKIELEMHNLSATADDINDRYQRALLPLQNQLDLMQRIYDQQSATNQLSDLDEKIKQERILAEDQYSQEGRQAAAQLKDDLQRRREMVDQQTYNAKRLELEDSLTQAAKDRDAALAPITAQQKKDQEDLYQLQLKQYDIAHPPADIKPVTTADNTSQQPRDITPVLDSGKVKTGADVINGAIDTMITKFDLLKTPTLESLSLMFIDLEKMTGTTMPTAFDRMDIALAKLNLGLGIKGGAALEWEVFKLSMKEALEVMINGAPVMITFTTAAIDLATQSFLLLANATGLAVKALGHLQSGNFDFSDMTGDIANFAKDFNDLKKLATTDFGALGTQFGNTLVNQGEETTKDFNDFLQRYGKITEQSKQDTLQEQKDLATRMGDNPQPTPVVPPDQNNSTHETGGATVTRKIGLDGNGLEIWGEYDSRGNLLRQWKQAPPVNNNSGGAVPSQASYTMGSIGGGGGGIAQRIEVVGICENCRKQEFLDNVEDNKGALNKAVSHTMRFGTNG